MPKSPSGGLGNVPAAAYTCAAGTAAVRDAEERARHYAATRHWCVAGAWSDDDPSVPLDARPAWKAVMGALSSGLVRGIVVAGASHVAHDARQFTALGVLVRGRRGFLADAKSRPTHLIPGQHERLRALFEASSGWRGWMHPMSGAVS
jgi:hypothetical protein